MNGSNFKIYALLGEVYGLGCPLGYFFIRFTEDAQSGEKEQYLTAFLGHIQKQWIFQVLFTLTDKDLSEINVF